jgi:NAD(P)-dependent dehydrogenase (short-subunit alcohol dehydrogenase family)
VSLRNQVVAITGASAGVGRATAVAFADAGANVALLARGAERLEAARRDVEARGVRALALCVDVADAAQVDAAVARIETELGPIAVWVNNAMATIFAPILEITPEELARATAVTYFGTVYGTVAALKRMRYRDRGTIVQVGSALAYRAIPLQAPYCAAKFAVRAFTDSLRTELLHDGSRVRVTMVQLAAFNTPQFDWARSRMPRRAQPVGPVFQPEVAARAIVWAAVHRRRELWVGFPSVKAIVAQKLAPGLADRLLARSAWEGQMTDEEAPADRLDNLFEPVPGDFGAHGRFDARARERSWQLAASKHRGALVFAALFVLVLGAAWLAFHGVL